MDAHPDQKSGAAGSGDRAQHDRNPIRLYAYSDILTRLQLFFDKTWAEYKAGFGDPETEYFIGLDNLYRYFSLYVHHYVIVIEKLIVYHSLTNDVEYKLVIRMWDVNDNYAYATYKTFKVADDVTYQLDISSFNAVNKFGLRDELSIVNGANFSTKDQDNSGGACADKPSFNSAGWFSSCPGHNLFGENKFTDDAFPDKSGIFWFSFGGSKNSFKRVWAGIRPKSFNGNDRNISLNDLRVIRMLLVTTQSLMHLFFKQTLN